MGSDPLYLGETLVKICVYTAIFGDFPNKLYRPENIPDDVELHCYTDVEYELADPSGWKLMPPRWEHATNPRLRARRHKLLAHQLYPGADYTLWVDGCLTPLDNPHELVAKYLQNDDICLFDHMQRDCIYQEMEACRKLQKDDWRVIDYLEKRYKDEGYPTFRGLAETTAVLRRNNHQTRVFNEKWWEELKNNSIRDQLSFDYCMWVLGQTYATFEGTRTSSPHFKWRAHR